MSWFDDWQVVRRLQPNLPFLTTIYFAVRFLTSPFREVESAVPQEGVIVDVGCGYGLFANLMAIRSSKRHVIACDIDVGRIKRACSSIGSRTNISFFVANEVASLPSCDVVTMVDVLHHVAPTVRKKLLAEAFQKLRPGGCLIVKDIDKVPRAKYLWNYAQDLLMTRGGPCYFLDETEMCNLLQQHGFAVTSDPLNTHLLYSHILYRCEKLEHGVDSVN